MKIGIIGGGNMGFTYADSFLHAEVVHPKDLHVFETNPKRLEFLRQKTNCKIHEGVNDSIKKLDLIILAIKPQNFDEVTKTLSGLITENHTILSVMAGISLKKIANGLNTNKVVRAMPNLPAQIGFGMTVFTSSEEVTKQDLFKIHNLINTTGKSLYVDNETLVDAATAISGSGPAYVYFFMDALMNSALEMGFTKSEAELLVEQTFFGAIHLYKRKDYSFKEWIEMVSSKGGTTEAAFSVLKNKDTATDLKEAFNKAFERAKELGN